MPKKDNDGCLTITNAKILDFFNKHSSVNHEQFILFFIEHLDKMFNSMSGEMNASTVSNALEHLQQSFISLSNKVNESKDKIRHSSCIICLNDDYIGGEFIFEKQNFKYKMSKNDIIIFPPYYTHPHLTLPLENRTYRYTINTWFLSP